MTVDEFSRWWRQSKATTYRQIQAGQIPVVRIRENGALRIPRDELEARLGCDQVSVVGPSSAAGEPAERRAPAVPAVARAAARGDEER